MAAAAIAAGNTEVTPSPPASTIASPEQRPSSPSLSASPSLAISLDTVPLLDRQRSVSTPSSTTCSTLSTRSRNSRLSDGAATVVRRRGYMRPQGTSFADSARNRDSVMSLGSIAHMQYYFARTGLLDGKGAQLAREGRKSTSAKDKENQEPTLSGSSLDEYNISTLSFHDGSSSYAISDSGIDHSVVESPTELSASSEAWLDPSDHIMLPPTVSTYKVKPEYTEPLPDLPVLRRELKEALQDSCKVLEESQKHDPTKVADSSGYHEVQGLHLFDIITLAIRAAKNYYTAHSNPQKLYAIRTEKDIRSDLYQVLDILKRMASRNFKGGIRLDELTAIIIWIEGIDNLLKREEGQEQQEAAERESWVWRHGDWAGKEREREWLFLRSFDQDEPPLPQWPESVENQTFPNEFLLALQDGQRLVKLHNALVARSKRRFDEIKTWHTDVAKPYRMAENLQYWVKAAELRWDIFLTVPALDVVHGKDADTWEKFDHAIFKWCQGVRAELTEEWRLEALAQERKRPPELKIDMPEAEQDDEDPTPVIQQSVPDIPLSQQESKDEVPVLQQSPDVIRTIVEEHVAKDDGPAESQSAETLAPAETNNTTILSEEQNGLHDTVDSR